MTKAVFEEQLEGALEAHLEQDLSEGTAAAPNRRGQSRKKTVITAAAGPIEITVPTDTPLWTGELL